MHSTNSGNNSFYKSTIVFKLKNYCLILFALILVSCKEISVDPTTPIEYYFPTTTINLGQVSYGGIGYFTSNTTYTGNSGIVNSLTITGTPLSGSINIVDYQKKHACSACSYIIFKANSDSYYSQSGVVSISGNSIILDAKMYQLSNTTLLSDLTGTIYF
jgi:hypothetical protein